MTLKPVVTLKPAVTLTPVVPVVPGRAGAGAPARSGVFHNRPGTGVFHHGPAACRITNCAIGPP
ncbi:hypothetical protein ACWD4G_22600 [Streptomyces sp. NPDC002643]